MKASDTPCGPEILVLDMRSLTFHLTIAYRMRRTSRKQSLHSLKTCVRHFWRVSDFILSTLPISELLVSLIAYGRCMNKPDSLAPLERGQMQFGDTTPHPKLTTVQKVCHHLLIYSSQLRDSWTIIRCPERKNNPERVQLMRLCLYLKVQTGVMSIILILQTLHPKSTGL